MVLDKFLFDRRVWAKIFSLWLPKQGPFSVDKKRSLLNLKSRFLFIPLLPGGFFHLLALVFAAVL